MGVGAGPDIYIYTKTPGQMRGIFLYKTFFPGFIESAGHTKHLATFDAVEFVKQSKYATIGCDQQ